MKVKAKRTSTDGKEDELTRLLNQAVATRGKIVQLEEAHEAIFETHRELLDDLKGLEERIKIEARRRVVPGQTTVIIDNAHIHVSVQHRVNRTYDTDKAKKYWPEDILEHVMAVDKNLVKAYEHHLGLLLKKALIEEETTPAVSVRLT